MSLPDLRWGAISSVSVTFFWPWVFRILQMELEAENLWIHRASHDFYDKKISSKNINFFLSKIFFETSLWFSKNIFLKIEKVRKFLLKININFSKKLKKSRFFIEIFQLFWKFLYWFSMKIFDFQIFFLKIANVFRKQNSTRK